jgi:hypothetical protein
MEEARERSISAAIRRSVQALRSVPPTLRALQALKRDNTPPNSCSGKWTMAKDFEITTGGPQTSVTQPNVCTGHQDCSHQVSFSITTSTAVTSGQTTTNTVSGGVSVSYSAGIDFIVSDKAEATFHAEVAHSWATEKSSTVGTSTQNGVTETITQAAGTTAFLSFTPIFRCTIADWTCSDDKGSYTLTQWAVCTPAWSPDGKTMSGEYAMVYMSSV